MCHGLRKFYIASPIFARPQNSCCEYLRVLNGKVEVDHFHEISRSACWISLIESNGSVMRAFSSCVFDHRGTVRDFRVRTAEFCLHGTSVSQCAVEAHFLQQLLCTVSFGSQWWISNKQSHTASKWSYQNISWVAYQKRLRNNFQCFLTCAMCLWTQRLIIEHKPT